MLEILTGITSSSTLGMVGILATLVTIVVQVLKNVLPESIPTKLLTLIVALILTVAATLIFSGITVETIFFSIFGSFIVAYASMFGFDTMKELFERFKKSDGE